MRVLALLVCLAACGPTTTPVEDPRGDTNGRMFDFVSTKRDGSEWTIRIRGDALWVAYAKGEKTQDYPPQTLSAKEAAKVWKLIDRLDLENRDEGAPDDDAGTVTLRLREPTSDDNEDDQAVLAHDLITSYVPRDTDDEDVLDLADYLIDLVQKHDGVAPAF
jgi:hypothetical protein